MGRYRLKHHGVESFWDWMASWARMARSPEDLGFDGSRFKLLPLNVQMVKTENAAPVDGGDLFGVSQLSATDMHRVKRQTAEGGRAPRLNLCCLGCKRARGLSGAIPKRPTRSWQR